MTARSRHDWILLALLGLLTGNACSSDSPGSGAGGSGGGGGASGSGGQAGTGESTPPGTGGSGSGGAVGDSGSDTSSDDRSSDTPVGGGPTLDACFTGLRAGVGGFQIATKASADGRYRVRLALEDQNSGGTAGTHPWSAFRVGIETPAGNVCVTDAAALATAYKLTHHNCQDTVDLTVAGRRFLIIAPDTDPFRPNAKLTIFMGATMLDGPIDLLNVTCTANEFPTCQSGRPC